MAWNEPGKNDDNEPKSNPNGRQGDQDGRNNNPWGSNQGGRDQGPPDLDQIFKNLSQKLSGTFGGGNNSSNSGSPKGSLIGMGVVGAIALVVWVGSGFYTVGEAERGVVLRLGKYSHIVDPGLNWRPRFIDNVSTVNVQAIRSLNASGLMLTKDENVVTVTMGVQYKVSDPYKYLYRVTNADDSLSQATDSALRAVIGDSLMDGILTSGRQQIRQKTQETVNTIIENYDMGISVVDVNFQSSRPPEQVKDAFDDAIAAREDEERFIRLAEAYKNEILPKALGRAERLKKEAQGYSERVTNEAEGQVAQFTKLLPEYIAAPGVTRERLYLDTMEKVYSNSSKILIDSDSTGNMLYLPIDRLMSQGQTNDKKVQQQSNQSQTSYDGIQLESDKKDDDKDTEIGNTTSTRKGRFE